MKKLLLFISTILSCHFLQAQCNCYAIEDISMSTEESGIMKVTFTNACDNNVYHLGWVISKTSNDTLARYDECICGFVLPLNTPVSWNFKTELSEVPSLENLRVSITNGTLSCSEVYIYQPTGITKTMSKSLKIYPIPFEDKIRVEDPDNSEMRKVPFEITDINGTTMAKGSIENFNTELDLGFLPKGFYFIGFYNEQNQRTSFKIVK